MQELILGIDCGLMALIWTIQIVVYPNFAYIEASRFADWHADYTRKMGYLVAPLMTAQLGLALWAAATLRQTEHWVALALVVGTWISTFAISVPIHRRLQERGRDPREIRRLVSSNWIRVALWSALALRHAL